MLQKKFLWKRWRKLLATVLYPEQEHLNGTKHPKMVVKLLTVWLVLDGFQPQIEWISDTSLEVIILGPTNMICNQTTINGLALSKRADKKRNEAQWLFTVFLIFEELFSSNSFCVLKEQFRILIITMHCLTKPQLWPKFWTKIPWMSMNNFCLILLCVISTPELKLPF